ncbi:sulfotransferase family 2 domain-containing protein [Candidatus Marifrigoribacter sp. Uisw_064]|uniref:sulfotransferase family 2 domain-containing protein n=1 Tax=Candidatus Marifrigoribacter sp. Uisw_064 TaxID=3230970 RepID=UPI003D48DBD6
MISHKHKCIFIHISKCAGSSIEKVFGLDIADNSEKNNKNLFGWNKEHNLYLQHATPQELLDYGFITKEQWNDYYKFIIVRNPWDRALSDYIWMSKEINKSDSFKSFINKKGPFLEVLTQKDGKQYRGDHLNKQLDYFYIDGEEVKYDKIIRFESLKNELPVLFKELNIKIDLESEKHNVGKKIFSHYSKFYNSYRKRLIHDNYENDIDYLKYKFEDKKTFFDHIKLFQSSKQLIK